MCIIVYKPKGIVLTPRTVENCFENNSDGAGFSYVDDGRIHTQKGFWTLGAFKEAFAEHEAKQAILHFRIKTHGDYSEENCHPFHITQSMVFAHNGVITALPKDKKKSDTHLFNELILKKLIANYGNRFIKDKVMRHLIAHYIGSSKLVFLDSEGNVSFINESLGNWDSECWFSNYSWNWDRKWQPTKPKQADTPLIYENHSSLQTRQDAPTTTAPLPQVIPLYPTSSNGGKDIIKLNSYVRLGIDIGIAKAGWLGKVMGFHPDATLEVWFPIHKVSKRIPIAVLNPVACTVIPPSENIE